MYSIFTVILCVMGFANVAVSTSEMVCGRIRSHDNVTVVMYDGVLQSKEDFEKLQSQKLMGAIIDPESGCAIQICGYSSYNKRLDESFIGSLEDYSSCWTYQKQGPEKPFIVAPTPPYNELFNTSSISCSCRKTDPNCGLYCSERQKYSIHSWKANECALLFPEKKCNSCRFSPVSLERNHTFSTNHTIHISTIQVRDSCVVYHSAPAFKKYYWFRDQPQPSEYWSDYGEHLVVSAYDIDPEAFTCQCGVSPNENHGGSKYLIVSAFISVVIACSIATLLCILRPKMKAILARRRALNEPDIYGIQEVMEVLNGYPNCLVNFKDADPPEKLGEGYFGKVFLGVVVKSKTERDSAAIKKLYFHDDEKRNKLQKMYFKQEIEAFQAVAEPSHANIVKFFGASVVREERDPYMAIITEFCNKDTLMNYMGTFEKKFANLMNEDGYDYQIRQEEIQPTHFPDILQLFKWAKQIASGVMHLHSKRIIYGDLATRNMLLKEIHPPDTEKSSLIIKLCDFGLAVKYRKTSGGYIGLRMVGPGGACHIPPESLAPELKEDLDNNQIKDGEIRITRECDAWAFGRALGEIFSQCQNGGTPTSESNNTVFSNAEKFLLKISEKSVFDIIKKCREIKPEDRPKFEDLYTFFAKKVEEWEEKVSTAALAAAEDN